MADRLAAARDALAAIHPDLPWALGPLVTFGVVYAVRRWRPLWWLAAFAWLPSGGSKVAELLVHATQAFASALPFTVLAAVAGGGDPVAAVRGLGCGLAAPVLHHALKWIRAVPYRGALGAGATFPERESAP